MIQDQFRAFIDDLKNTHGANLASVILYGSAASGDFIAQRSDYNLLIALKKITPADLRAAQAPMREWHRMGHHLPVYFTVAEVKDGADVFPIEFHQMEKARVVLYGEDVLAGVTFTDANLRHQTEYELRSKLIQLRRHYIPVSMSAEKLTQLMNDSLGSFVALFRAVLLLHDIEPPLSKPEVISATEKHLGLNVDVFERITALRAGSGSDAKMPTDVKANELFTEYMEQIERVINAVDKLNKT
ncbi:MAG TPA: nucleotidyltransferase domain-containing protein [Pyrinomonadaceae bacterium]|jgi:predicted nucleotidyltransferase|nr:nucleotidyltransferase domain-containing protein [Pyrinomonadaceae bacterium]